MGESSWKYNRSFIKDHEWGHTRQSIRWGWLYLPGPGLCSICWVGLRRISEKLRRKSYYSVWPENQADKFGGSTQKIMSFIVYKHTSPSNKVYIGITKLNLIKRWQVEKATLIIHISLEQF